MTPMLTTANAPRVPMLVASASCPRETKAAGMAMMMQTITVLKTGVCVRGLARVKALGSSPSRT